MNQAILCDTDLVNILLDFLSEDGQEPKALSPVFRCLTAVASHNKKCQHRLFDDLDLIVKASFVFCGFFAHD